MLMSTMKEVKNLTFTQEQYKIINRGQMYWVDNLDGIGSEQQGKRPVIILQNDIGNKYAPTVLVAVISSQLSKAKLPTHVEISTRYGLERDSVILVEQMRTIDKRRLGTYIGTVDNEMLFKIDKAITIQTATQESFSYEKAYEFISMMHNISVAINQIGKIPSLSNALKIANRQYKEYCEKHNVNFQSIISQYNQRKVVNIM